MESSRLPHVPKPNLVVDSLLSLICARVGVNLKRTQEAHIVEELELNRAAHGNSVGFHAADKFDVARDFTHVQKPLDQYISMVKRKLLREKINKAHHNNKK
jgi:hypothetical protein